jgi:hypothetical protein
MKALGVKDFGGLNEEKWWEGLERERKWGHNREVDEEEDETDSKSMACSERDESETPRVGEELRCV